ncbi:hypothetical protein Q0F98_27225 [Paenibacillus amylolyticus]|nr:hypothetical protein Q0F98_27225 [Paenibacillus amylolyticus]
MQKVGKRNTRNLAWIISVVMVMSVVLSACGNKEEGQVSGNSGNADDPLEVSIMTITLSAVPCC